MPRDTNLYCQDQKDPFLLYMRQKVQEMRQLKEPKNIVSQVTVLSSPCLCALAAGNWKDIWYDHRQCTIWHHWPPLTFDSRFHLVHLCLSLSGSLDF